MSEYSVQPPMCFHLRQKLERVCMALRANRMDACWVETKEDVRKKVQEMVPDGSVVTCGGTMTLAECGIMELLRSGAYQFLDRGNVSAEDIPKLYRDAFSADYYFMSSNAITEQGELYNVDGNGNRVAALIFGPKHVIVVAGANKIVPNLSAAVQRVKEIAAPVNAMRLEQETPCAKTGLCVGRNGDMAAGCQCTQRICSSYVVSGYQRVPDRIHVILVAENLGY